MQRNHSVIRTTFVLVLVLLTSVQEVSMSQPICCTNCDPTSPGKVVTRNTSIVHPNTVKQINQQKFKAKSTLQPKQAGNGVSYQHTINGEWDTVISQMGFFMDVEGLGNSFINIIGLPTSQIGETEYETFPWDRKAFWVYINDGAPLHLGADFDGEYETLDTQESVYVYYVLFLLYQQQGKDYSNTDNDGEFVYLELVTDLDNNVLEYYAYSLDENDEILDEIQFNIGDGLMPVTTILDLNDPEIAWGVTMEDEYRIITKEPEFTYEHLTPNKDFENTVTAELIDFSQVDLHMVLWAQLEEWNNSTFAYSTAKDLQTKWDDQPQTGIFDWLSGLF